MLRAACAYALMEMLARYDALNAKAISRVVAQGAQIVVLTPETLRALRNALEQVLDEEAAKSAQFKTVLDNWRAFRGRTAPLVLDRRRPHRDVGLCADGGGDAVARSLALAPLPVKRGDGCRERRERQSTSASLGCGVSTTQK